MTQYSNVVDVNHITFSESGGAGRVASILVKHQNQLGSKAKLVSLTATNLQVQPLQYPVLTLSALVDRFIVSADSRDTLFSLYRNRLSLAKDLVNSTNKDEVLHLHWTSGLISNQTFRNLLSSGRRIVWTLHDMVSFTGGCHHAHDCAEYQRTCQGCPQVRPFFQHQVQIAKIQNAIDGHYPNLRIVTPTNWLEKSARNSSSFGGSRITTIPNPISELFFSQYSKVQARMQLGISNQELIFIVIANNLADPAKGIDRLVKVTTELFNRNNSKGLLLLVGSNGAAFEKFSSHVRWLGCVSPSELPKIAVAADWVLSGSAAESAGMTIAECGALGIPSIALSSGGIQEMIVHGETGFLSKSLVEFDKQLSKAINRELQTVTMGQKAQAFANRWFHPVRVTSKYLNLYADMVG